ncbi:MAG: hypothetical protein R3F17_08745 [Planctomycetota bacterium]
MHDQQPQFGGRQGSANEFRVQHVYEIGAGDWEGTEFALLANNVNCLLCHTNVDNAQRYYNNDANKMGTFDRVRLGSIETFHVRSKPDSRIAGTIYLGGDAVQADGSRLDNWHSLSLQSAEFTEEGKLVEDAWGKLRYNALDPASALNPDPMENLYLDYLAGGDEAQIDGVLPSSFPSPFPDNGGIDPLTKLPTPEFGGNRKVDSNEFLAATAGTGGAVSGGSVSVMKKDWTGRITNDDRLHTMLAGNATSLSGQTDGNVYLNGTKDNPLILNGDVAIDGDLIISGYVKGVGSLRVSGNVYIPSDLQYMDGATSAGGRTFGTGADGSSNTLAIASGGNVVIGDYYRPSWGKGNDTNGWGSGSFSFLMEEAATFNRMEWMKTQPTLPGESVYVKTGENVWYEDVAVKVKETYWEEQNVYEWQKTGNQIQKTAYKWITVNNGMAEPYYSEWQEKVVDYYYWVDEEVKVLVSTKQVKKNRWVETGEYTQKEHVDEIWEWQTPQYDNPYFQGANYVPRYYAFAEGTYAPIPNKQGHFDPDSSLWIADEIVGGWNSSKLNLPRTSVPTDPFLFDANGDPIATVVNISPKANWIDAVRMKQLIRDMAKERDEEQPFTLDATIYSNNSIFGMVADDKQAGTNGTMLINGLIVAADVGLLAPRGTQINYDPRGRDLMDIDSDSSLQIRRHVRTPLP